MKICVVYCTVPDNATADAIAKALVNKKLAACVKIIPDVTSVYFWENDVVTDREFQLIIKTTEHNIENAFALVEMLHPYDIPEWVVVHNASASESYGQWITEQTAIKK